LFPGQRLLYAGHIKGKTLSPRHINQPTAADISAEGIHAKGRHAVNNLIPRSNEEAQNNLGYALSEQGKYQEAIFHLTEALRIKPNLAATHYNLGNALMRQEKYQEAIDHFTESLRIMPGLADVHSNLGRQGNELVLDGNTEYHGEDTGEDG
jgi:tetratricopeptide (TPR) repeat protein